MIPRFSSRLFSPVCVLGLIGVAWLLASHPRTFAADPAPAPGQLVRHFVAFKFKPEVTPAQIAEVNAALLALKGKIKGIISIERGDNNSPENKNHGFTDGFLLTFRTPADRDAYLVDPAHRAFGRLAGPRFTDVFVFDYVTNAPAGE